MAKDTAQANEAGIAPNVLMIDLNERIAANIVDVELFMENEEIKERLGERYDKILDQINRRITFGIKAVESFIGKTFPGFSGE